jgi:hypothetical protein
MAWSWHINSGNKEILRMETALRNPTGLFTGYLLSVFLSEKKKKTLMKSLSGGKRI